MTNNIYPQDLFPDATHIREMQKELDFIIQEGVSRLTRLLANTESRISTGTIKASEEEVPVTVSTEKTRAYYGQSNFIARIVLLLKMFLRNRAQRYHCNSTTT